MKDDEILSRLDKIEHLKLSENKLIPILRIISEEEPDRYSIKRRIMGEEYPSKSEKSVFRAMVTVAIRRLNLARLESDQIRLSPNGKFSLITEDNIKERLSLCIRDLAVLTWGLDGNVLRRGKELKDEMGNSLKERFSRFNNYLDEFRVNIPKKNELKNSPIKTLYPSVYNNIIIKKNKRRNLLISSLKKDKMIQMDEARLKIIQNLFNQGYSVTSYFVDHIFLEEWKSKESIIELWEGASAVNDISGGHISIDFSKIKKRNRIFNTITLESNYIEGHHG